MICITREVIIISNPCVIVFLTLYLRDKKTIFSGVKNLGNDYRTNNFLIWKKYNTGTYLFLGQTYQKQIKWQAYVEYSMNKISNTQIHPTTTL